MENDGYTYELLNHLPRQASTRAWALPFVLSLHVILWGGAAALGGVTFRALTRAVWPLVLLNWNLIPLYLNQPTGMWSLYLTMSLMGLAAGRVVNACTRRPQAHLRPWLGWLLAAGICVVLGGWLFIFLEAMWRLLLLGHPDIGIFVRQLRNTLSYGSFLQWHSAAAPFEYYFCPGMVLLLPFFWLNPTIHGIIGMQCVVIGGTGLLLFAIARYKGLTSGQSLLLLICYVLFPATTQTAYCYSYGFHTNVIALPFLILGMVLLMERRYIMAVIALLIAVSFKEYLAIYVFGIGLAVLATGRRRTGVVLAVASILYYVITTIIFAEYRDSIHHRVFGGLGDSLGEMMLAPVTRPGIFWSQLVMLKNWQLVLELLLPMAGICLLAPRLMLALLPLFGLSFLRTDLQSGSIAFQYQTCTIGVLFVAAIYGLAALGTNTDDRQSETHRGWLVSICGRMRGAQRYAWLAAASFAGVYAAMYMSLSPISKQNIGIVPGGEQLMQNQMAYRDVSQLVPMDATVTGDHRTMAWFLDRRLCGDFEYEPIYETDYHVYQERFWNHDPSYIRGHVDDLLSTGKFEIIYYQHGIFVLRRRVPLPPPADDVF